LGGLEQEENHKQNGHSTEENHKIVDITLRDIDYVVQCPRFMDMEALQNKVTAKAVFRYYCQY